MQRNIPKKLAGEIAKLTEPEKDLITKAYKFARKKHSGQKRRSGSPYIQHPLKIAFSLLSDHYDATTVAAGLLHDTIEDTDTTEEELTREFGTEIASIVSGVTKVSLFKIKEKDRIFSDDEKFLSKVDNYRKILLAAITDPRVIIVKLYDRLDNIETLRWLLPEKQKFYARETIEIFAPLAERLGMGKLKGLLEDISFPYAYPEQYKSFLDEISGLYENPQRVVDRVRPEIKRLLQEDNIAVESISGRAKHHYSLYKKIKRKGNFKLVFDIIALRIVVKTIEDCYKVLGLIHSHYQPHPNRIHDYIARPKLNGYQSIHTTVQDKDGNLFEVQIRTEEMHQFAEFGRASHWDYKNDKRTKKDAKEAAVWLRELEKIKEIEDRGELLGQLKNEFFSDQIFIFTPKGDIIDLPVESTGIDFAYRIHTKIGDHLSGVKINGRIVPISTPLKTGDAVEIITSIKAIPSRDWLKIAKTSQARQHIRNYFRNTQYDALLAKGMNIFNKLLGALKYPLIKKNDSLQKIENMRLPYKTLDKALIALAENNLSRTKLVKALHPDFDSSEKRLIKFPGQDSTSLKALKGIRHSFAGCCQVAESKEVVGYLTKEHIIKIHRKDCKRLIGVDPRRIIDLKP